MATVSNVGFGQNFFSKIKVYLAKILAFNLFPAGFSRNQGEPHFIVAKIARQFLPWRWPLMALLSLVVFIVEAEEHIPESVQLTDYLFDFEFVREIIVYGLLFPLIGGIVLEMVERLRLDRRHVTRHLHRQQELNQQLVNILEWDELTNLLVRFPRSIAPFTGIFLLIYNHDRTKLELAAEWRDPRSQVPSPIVLQPTDLGHMCAFVHSFSMNSLAPCHCLDNPASSDQDNYYCLPLVHGNLPIALLHFYLPPNISLTTYQVAILNGLAPSMALALDSIQPKRLMTQTEATEAERRRIAQHLHDTLGQHLGYLRLKLDHLTGDDVLWEIAAVKQELGHMRDIANEAYEQVRGTLASLHPPNSTDLATALLAQAKLVSQQTNFEVEFSSEGESRPLSPIVQQQILYLFQEALTNVAKHADAHGVRINLLWLEKALKITLADDGRGFEPKFIQTEGHFGLVIMHERAEEINGHLTIISHPDVGTEVILQLPLDPVV